MVRSIRKNYNGAFKAKVALEAVKGEKPLAQLSSEFGLHSNSIGQWRKQLLKELPSLFAHRRTKHERDQEELVSELYRHPPPHFSPAICNGHISSSRVIHILFNPCLDSIFVGIRETFPLPHPSPAFRKFWIIQVLFNRVSTQAQLLGDLALAHSFSVQHQYVQNGLFFSNQSPLSAWD
jgi:transposase